MVLDDMNERFQIGCLTGGVPLRFGSSSRFIGLRTIKIDKHLPSALVFAILIYLYLEVMGSIFTSLERSYGM